jgi:PAS domain S-box-containing protein
LADDPAGADLACAALKVDGLPCVVTPVLGAGDSFPPTDPEGWDLILSEYVFRGEKGTALLDRVRSAFPDVPFVFLASALNEEEVVRIMRYGAADCILKDRIARLGEAVRRALRARQELRARERAEAEARDAGALARQVIDSANVGIIVLDRQLRYMSMNPLMERISGVRVREVLGKTPMEVFPFIREKGVDKLLARALEGETINVPDMQAQGRTPDRTEWISTRICPLRDGKGDVSGVIVMILDVTERKKVEIALFESEERFREVAENLRGVFWSAEPDFSRFNYISPGFEALWGRSREDLYNSRSTWTDSIHPEDRERVMAAAADLPRLGNNGLVYRILRPDGSAIWVRDNAAVVRDGEGKVVRIVGIVEDISALKDVEEALRESERKLEEALQRSQERVVQLEEQVRSRAGLENMAGRSAPMQEVYRKIRLAAQSDVTVLLTGESGTGKELAAEAIHGQSARKGKSLVAVNCAAIPETLLESELFGHVKGAFTGAVRDKQGLFEVAHGGTLFLDEVGDLPSALQVKVLRAIQEREIRRVGDSRTIRVDVRLISATNRDLASLVARGAVREDFFYRIRVFEIALPPLRDRRDDIPLLISRFVSEFAASTGKAVKGVATGAIQRLMEYPWPGNVRELRNAIEHAFVTLKGDHVSLTDLPPEVRGHPGSAPLPSKRFSAEETQERRKILDALRKSGGSREKAARALGISRVTLWKRMRRMGIRPEEEAHG